MSPPAPWSREWELHQGTDVKIGRTKTGLLLLAVGFALSWIPVIGALGGLLALFGLILLFLGRDALDDAHHRYVVIGAVLLVVSVLLAVFGAVALVAQILNLTRSATPGTTPSELVDQLTGALQTYIITIVLSVILGAIAQTIMVLRIADRTTRWVLVAGVVSAIAVSIYLPAVIWGQIGPALAQSTAGGTFSPGPIDGLQAQIQSLSLLKVFPSLCFAYAYWRCRTTLEEGPSRSAVAATGSADF